MNIMKYASISALLLSLSFSHAEKVTVLAAASLQNAVDDIREAYKEKYSNADIETLYDSSSNLARQIEQGMPAQIFISANQSWMDHLEERQLIEIDSRKNIVNNELALITYYDNDQSFDIEFDSQEYWDNLLKESRLAVGDPDHVPVGLYAKEAFKKLGVWESVEPRVAAAQNVRAALLLVEVKEASIGVVYSSDAKVSDKVKTITTFPSDLHEPIQYPIAIMKDQDSSETRQFYQFLLSDDAESIFKRYGFSTPNHSVDIDERVILSPMDSEKAMKTALGLPE